MQEIIGKIRCLKIHHTGPRSACISHCKWNHPITQVTHEKICLLVHCECLEISKIFNLCQNEFEHWYSLKYEKLLNICTSQTVCSSLWPGIYWKSLRHSAPLRLGDFVNTKLGKYVGGSWNSQNGVHGTCFENACYRSNNDISSLPQMFKHLDHKRRSILSHSYQYLELRGAVWSSHWQIALQVTKHLTFTENVVSSLSKSPISLDDEYSQPQKFTNHASAWPTASLQHFHHVTSNQQQCYV